MILRIAVTMWSASPLCLRDIDFSVFTFKHMVMYFWSGNLHNSKNSVIVLEKTCTTVVLPSFC